MAITNLAGYIAAFKQVVELFSTAAITGTAGSPFSAWTGTLAGTSTTAGVVPTTVDVGQELGRIDAFGAGRTGYLTKLMFNNAGSNGWSNLYDLVWKGGAYGFNANVTLSAQPSYASRVPGGTDFTNTEIWLECVTAFTGNLTYNITYTNQDGVTGRTAGASGSGLAPTVRRMLRMSLQAGDTGVQKIESVVATVSTAGTFNVLVLRRLATLRVGTNGLAQMDLFKLGMPEVFADSALVFAIAPDSTSTSLADVFLTIANG